MAKPHSTFTSEELQTEEWRSIPGYEGRYSVSSLGRIRSDHRYYNTYPGKILSLKLARGKRWYVSLRIGASRKMFSVHRLVARAFLGEQPNLEVNHKDGNPLNNRLTNLEYLTALQNTYHYLYELGGIERMLSDQNPSYLHNHKLPRGEKHHKPLLTEDAVRQIRADHAAKIYSRQRLADRWGVSLSTIK